MTKPGAVENGQWEEHFAPDFTVYGFHTGKKITFRCEDGTEHTDIYQGWGIFGSGVGRTDVVAWKS